MTAPNLYPEAIAAVDQVDRAALLAAGYLETGAGLTLAVETTATAAYGVRYATATANGATAGNIDFPPRLVTAGETYSWGLQQQRLVGASRTHRLDRRFYSDVDGTVPIATGATVTGSSATTAAPGAFVKSKSEGWVVPAGAVSCRPRLAYLATNTPAVGDKIAFDAVQFEQGATLSDEVVAPAVPTIPGPKVWTGPVGALIRLRYRGPLGVPAVADPMAALRAEANAPINDTDALVQAGNLSSFTTVTTFAALQSALAAGQRVRVSGNLTCTGQLLFVSGSALYIDAGAAVLKGYSSSGATSSTFLRTQNINSGSYKGKAVTPSHDVFIGGPGAISSSSSANGGNMVGIIGDRLALDGFKSTLWNGGRYCVGIGDDWRVRRVDWRGGQLNGSGNGGLRYMGGARFRAIGGYCEAGDDTWQVVQAGAVTDPLFDVDSSDSVYIDCTGSSSSARFIIAALQSDSVTPGTVNMAASILGARFINCDGFSGGSAIVAKNTNSSGVIDGFEVIDSSADGSMFETTTGQPGALYLEGLDATGGVRNTKITDTDVTNQHRPGFRTAGGQVRDTTITRGRLERGLLQLTAPVVENDAINTTISGTVLAGMGSNSTRLVDNQSATSNISFVSA